MCITLSGTCDSLEELLPEGQGWQVALWDDDHRVSHWTRWNSIDIWAGTFGSAELCVYKWERISGFQRCAACLGLVQLHEFVCAWLSPAVAAGGACTHMK